MLYARSGRCDYDGEVCEKPVMDDEEALYLY